MSFHRSVTFVWVVSVIGLTSLLCAEQRLPEGFSTDSRGNVVNTRPGNTLPHSMIISFKETSLAGYVAAELFQGGLGAGGVGVRGGQHGRPVRRHEPRPVIRRDGGWWRCRVALLACGIRGAHSAQDSPSRVPGKPRRDPGSSCAWR